MKNLESVRPLRLAAGIATVLLLASCSDEPHEPRVWSNNGSTPNAWGDQSGSQSDQPSEQLSEELRNSPAYQAAAAGNIDKGKAIVAAGEDTKEHLIMGIKYHCTHETFAQSLSEMQVDLNEAEYNSIKSRAENGDPEAQAWMEKNGHTFKVLNDSAKEMNNNSTPPNSANGSNSGSQ